MTILREKFRKFSRRNYGPKFSRIDAVPPVRGSGYRGIVEVRNE